jgi:competence protein ComGC
MAHNRKAAAFTRRDLVVVIAVFFVLGLFLIPALRRANQKSRSLCCNCNFKQIGTAYRIWANDHHEQFPAFAPLINGGWREILSRTNAGAYCWMNYATMSNEMGESTLILVCPADVRKAAGSFSNFAANTNLSYFAGVNANDSLPQSLLGGDRNLGPGTTPDPQYGFSPANGRGNDILINGPACWSRMMHSRGNPAGAGNILLGDGSAQQVSSVNLYANWVKPALAEQAAHNSATNSPGLRLIFP